MSFINTPDKFFTSNGDVNVLLAMSKAILDSLVIVEDGALELADRIVRLLRISTIYNTYYSMSFDAQNNFNEQMKAYEAMNSGVTDDVITYSKEQKTLDDTAIKAKQTNKKLSEERPQFIDKWDDVNDMVNSIYLYTDYMVSNEIKNRSIGDTDYNIPKDTTSANRRNRYFGDTDPRTTVNGGKGDINGPMPFPEFGQPFNNQMDVITDTLVNLTTFLPPNSDVSEFENNAITKGKYPDKIFKGWGIRKDDGTWIADPVRTFTKDTPFSSIINQQIAKEFSGKYAQSQPVGTVKFFIEKLHGRNSKEEPYKKNDISSQKEMFSPIDLSNRMTFAVYIDDFNETVSPQFTSYNFIGRGEEVPVYRSTKRTLNLTFSIIADYSLDLMIAMEQIYTKLKYEQPNEEQLKALIMDKQDWGLGYVGLPELNEGKMIGNHVPGIYSDTTETLWHKMTFLNQCCYAYYRRDGKMKEQPMIRLRLADMYDVTGIIDSVNYSFGEFDNMIDLNPSGIGNIPFSTKVNLSLTIIHSDEPSENFYGFFHRKEFDKLKADPVTGQGLSKNMSISKDGTQKKSPVAFNSTYANEALTDGVKLLSDGSLNKFQNGLQDFKSAFSKLGSLGINLTTEIAKSKAEKAILAYARISSIADELGPQYGLSNDKTKTLETDKKGANLGNNLLSSITGPNTINSVVNFAVDNSVDIITGKETFGQAINKSQTELTSALTSAASNAVIDTIAGAYVKNPDSNKIENDAIGSASKAKNSLQGQTREPKTIGDISKNAK